MARARRLSAKQRNLLVAAFSVAGHVVVLLALISARGEPPKAFEPEPMTVELAQLPPLVAPAAAAPAPAEPAPAQPPPPRIKARRAAPSPDVAPLLAEAGPTTDPGPALSDAQLAGAATAGSGAAGGACDMPRRLQAALRKDRLVRDAIAGVQGSPGKALFVWNGSWIRNNGQDGAGLAAVREAIMWEVGFAPEACRAEAVHGLVLLSLNDGPGAARVVVGSGDWRWSDLLGQRRRN